MVADGLHCLGYKLKLIITTKQKILATISKKKFGLIYERIELLHYPTTIHTCKMNHFVVRYLKSNIALSTLSNKFDLHGTITEYDYEYKTVACNFL